MKVDLSVARLYNLFVSDEAVRDKIWNMIVEEYRKTKKVLLQIREEKELLEHDSYLRQVLLLRKPYMTALSVFQIELLKKYRSETDESKKKLLAEQIASTIVGTSLGLRNTG
jgi:phosphoenolpyruvate carboxylase